MQNFLSHLFSVKLRNNKSLPMSLPDSVIPPLPLPSSMALQAQIDRPPLSTYRACTRVKCYGSVVDDPNPPSIQGPYEIDDLVPSCKREKDAEVLQLMAGIWRSNSNDGGSCMLIGLKGNWGLCCGGSC